MSSILTSLGRTVLAGFVLTLLIVVLFGSNVGSPGWVAFLFRYLHVLSGVMWIGLLWYFNFVQIPSMPKIPDEQKPAIGKVIAPTALFWFRFAAMATVLTGIILAIGLGMWIALIMAFNVWFIIWPNQKRALGIVVVDAELKAKSARTAMLTSRINTILSIPMLYLMVAQQNMGL